MTEVRGIRLSYGVWLLDAPDGQDPHVPSEGPSIIINGAFSSLYGTADEYEAASEFFARLAKQARANRSHCRCADSQPKSSGSYVSGCSTGCCS